MSFIKLSLSDYNEEYYKRLYNEKDNIIKPYTFAVFLKDAQFTKEEIIVENKKVELNIAIADLEIAVVLYNSFNHQKHKKFSIDKNSMTLENISMLLEKEIKEDEITIKFMSPLIARNRENQKDFYYSYEHKEFLETLKINLKEQLKITNIPTEYVDNFKIETIIGKKVITKFYEKKIEGTLGIFKLSGNKELLKYLYQAGIGSKRSSGFGMFQIV
jgi:CRISPR-associated endoribonuclease Cas6